MPLDPTTVVPTPTVTPVATPVATASPTITPNIPLAPAVAPAMAMAPAPEAAAAPGNFTSYSSHSIRHDHRGTCVVSPYTTVLYDSQPVDASSDGMSCTSHEPAELLVGCASYDAPAHSMLASLQLCCTLPCLIQFCSTD